MTDFEIDADHCDLAELVDTFYNLVTDVYEWGWGQSFHFSPLLPGIPTWVDAAAPQSERYMSSFIQFKSTLT